MSTKLLCEAALASGASVDVYLLRQRPALVGKETHTVDTSGNLLLKYVFCFENRALFCLHIHTSCAPAFFTTCIG